ncbi:hypothetical protein [Roseimicrobium sp. ORNL1]|uniref:hypothetical protein n=1 Tax=Roseimicrobium sp. ORNL1 TaxID=2711231 RepID=UPI0013E1B110|nr:hypothetical protein [Roseimicrobium sp. ORNL1]QIF02234.1 hypothetical protein G5S37_12075 [Roseimicrobium sp. ORNL1]
MKTSYLPGRIALTTIASLALAPVRAFADISFENEPPSPVDIWNDFIGLIVCSIFILIAAAVIAWICWWGVRARRLHSGS